MRTDAFTRVKIDALLNIHMPEKYLPISSLAEPLDLNTLDLWISSLKRSK